MSFDPGLYALVEEALEPLGGVSMRKMMGGATLYLDGTIFAILDEGEIWFKSDAAADSVWDAEGCERFGDVQGWARGHHELSPRAKRRL
jgi:DNA transformation protein